MRETNVRRLCGRVLRIGLSIGLVGLIGPATPRSVRAVSPFEKIGHVIVIFQENHAFDNYFGTFPGADGLANAGATTTQVDKRGQPYPTLPPPLARPDPGTTARQPDPRFPADLPNGPFRLNDSVEPGAQLGNQVHLFYRQQYQINGGKMDSFVAWTDAGGLVMGHWDVEDLPIQRLAREYTLADHFFHAAFGGSFLNHFWLVCACTPVFPDAPEAIVSVPFPDDPEHLQDRNVSPDGYAINTSYSVNQPHPAATPPEQLMPSQTMPTIGDRLSEAGIDWAWYSGGWNDALAGNPGPQFQYHHQPFAYFAGYADDTPARAQHLKDESDFLAALHDGTLPEVSFVKPIGEENEHPGTSTVRRGQDHLSELVAAIQASRYWADAAVIVTYDDNGGYWDHVSPPVIDRWGPGMRVPTVVVSPWARRGYVDHTVYDTTSVLRLIETRWNLAPLGTRDAAANDLANAFDFSAPAR